MNIILILMNILEVNYQYQILLTRTKNKYAQKRNILLCFAMAYRLRFTIKWYSYNIKQF